MNESLKSASAELQPAYQEKIDELKTILDIIDGKHDVAVPTDGVLPEMELENIIDRLNPSEKNRLREDATNELERLEGGFPDDFIDSDNVSRFEANNEVPLF